MKAPREGAAWIALLCAVVLVAGGTNLISPASAKGSINWKHIWNTKIKPHTDKRYYTKKKSNHRYYTKAQSATLLTSALANYYSKTDSDAKYALKTDLGNYYTKVQSDERYAAYPATIRGSYFVLGNGPAGAQYADTITFGVNLEALPTPHYILMGTTPPAGCSGTPAAPAAEPGNLCVFEDLNNNSTAARGVVSPVGTFGATSSFAAGVYATVSTAGQMFVYGSWALGVPAGGIAAKVPAAASHTASGARLGQ